MLCLTITQPWATLTAIGAKNIETRSWGTKYRGPLALHAAKGFPGDARTLCFRQPFHDVLVTHGYIDIESERVESLCWDRFPLGAVVAVCTLVGCVRFGYMPVWFDPPTGTIAKSYEPHGGFIQIPPDKDDPEYSFGDYSTGRYAWILSDIRPLPEPVPARGALGLWEWQGKTP